MELIGFVDRVSEDVAYITLTRGEETWWMEIPAAELANRGIRERRRFRMIIEVEPLPDCPVDEEAIERKLEGLS